VTFEAHSRVVVDRRRRRQQDETAGATQAVLGLADQPGADPLSLVPVVDRQVGQIAAVVEIGDRARHSHETRGGSRGDDQIGVCQHPVDTRPVGHRPPGGEGRRLEDADELSGRQVRLDLIADLALSS